MQLSINVPDNATPRDIVKILKGMANVWETLPTAESEVTKSTKVSKAAKAEESFDIDAKEEEEPNELDIALGDDEPSGPTLREVMQAFAGLKKAGKDAVIAKIYKQLGVKSVKDIPEDKWVKVLKAIGGKNA